MRYISGTIIMAVAVLAGCNGPNQSAEEFDQLTDANVPYDPSVIDLDAGESPGWEEPSRTAGQPARSVGEQAMAYGEPAAVTSLYSSTGRMHSVQRRDTLYSLARLYYNDHRQWKKIYEANRDRIANPNMIKVGMNLVIP
ncbi:MAG: LysM peptidoglycan-binding domain-containing protein [Planctomycetota bacterium]|nr:LysM peptidoglycan-binding domain-containing protein [Planctomycetota bacterium]